MAPAEKAVAPAQRGHPLLAAAEPGPDRNAWQRSEHEIIGFASAHAGQPASVPFASYSYIDVLRGQIPAAAF